MSICSAPSRASEIDFSRLSTAWRIGFQSSLCRQNAAIPKASQLPVYELDRTVTPSPVNPMGVKGAGEAGTIASTPAVANAVIDALAHLGVKHIDMPITAHKVWRALQDASDSTPRPAT